ncbi:hypothetical protein DL95DRAFT_489311 [Leptodontidium sp. 2 PMI_412]|nr:hypothetical protein DL95DRAFT_489311 [Leptodontidium sp. 2 PMI_412]
MPYPRYPRILLLGGHGRISLLLTPKLVSRSWDVVSVIRNPSQEADILEAGKQGPGNIKVLVESLEDVKSEQDAKKVLDQAKPDWVVWSAGAGGNGKERLDAIDRDACIYFIRASLSSPSITKFLLVSALNIRRESAPWWDEASWAAVKGVNAQALSNYYAAKLAADETITVLGEEKRFNYIVLRPGELIDGPETGRIVLGATPVSGQVSRADVAEVAVRLLEKHGVKGWFDLLGGENDVGEEVDRVVTENVDSREGESLDVMKKHLKL